MTGRVPTLALALSFITVLFVLCHKEQWPEPLNWSQWPLTISGCSRSSPRSYLHQEDSHGHLVVRAVGFWIHVALEISHRHTTWFHLILPSSTWNNCALLSSFPSSKNGRLLCLNLHFASISPQRLININIASAIKPWFKFHFMLPQESGSSYSWTVHS